MIQCKECDSEITEADAFCPYCGIALNTAIKTEEKGEVAEPVSPVDSASNSVEDAEGNVPVVTTADLLRSSDDEDNDSEEDVNMAETIVGVQPDFNAQKIAEEEKTEEDEFVDISSLKSNDEEKAENFVKETEEKESIQTPKEEVAIPPIENVEEPVNEVSSEADSEKSEEEKQADFLEDATMMMPFPSEANQEEEKDEGVPETESSEVSPSVGNVDISDDTDVPSEKIASEVNVAKPSDEQKVEDPISEASLTELQEEKNITREDRDDFKDPIPYVPEESPELNDVESSEIDEAVSKLDQQIQDAMKTGSSAVSLEEENVQVEEEQKEVLAEPQTSEPFESFEAESPEEKHLEEKVIEPELSQESEDFSVPDKIEPEDSIPEIEAKSDDVAELQSNEMPPIENEVAPETENRQEEAVEEAVSEDKKNSQTTPNIGVEDTDGSQKTKLKPLAEGTVLNNRYEIIRRIGGGGMGAVYLAKDQNLGGVLRAVKEMVQSYIEEAQQEKAVSDFKRESMLLSALEHPSIPTIYDYFFDNTEGRFYLVMKYISGGDLANKLRSAPEGKIDEKSVVEWGIQIADVLDYLHNRQPPIVYRDLKPANIMIDGNSGRAMLIDFGIARWVNKEEKGVTAVGTMGYAPPELFSGNVESRSDIYSLGSTMFHLLTGADPQSNPLLIFDFQKHPRPRQINSNLSDQIEQILMRAVEYQAEGRFTSAKEMRQALSDHLESLKTGNISYGVKEIPQAVGLAEQSVFCGFCGQKIVATDMFCAFCGAKQPMAQPGVHSKEYSLQPQVPQITAKLLIEGTSELDVPGFSLEKGENLVGRRDPMSNIFPEVDLSKFDPQTKISRKHARVWRDGDNYMIEDLGSSNGTVLVSTVSDSIRLMPHENHILNNGDIIRLGDTTLRFVVD